MKELAHKLMAALELGEPPVALRFAYQVPNDIPSIDRDLPSSCSYWRAAENHTFFASSDQHLHCAVGAMVMGFALPDNVAAQLGEVIKTMADCGYLSPAEAGAIPVAPKGHVGIVYGPLAEAPQAPDLVLLWASAKQAMLCGEAAGSAAWTSEPTTVTGRPGCAALPRAMSMETPAMSVGCIGMRTFTEISDDRIMVAIPCAGLATFVSELERLKVANNTMQTIYVGMLDDWRTNGV
jgi:uncharacterized protein (DUF169 family)